MRLLVGLGNPGDAYIRSRHNLGFVCLEAVAKSLGVKDWRQFKGGELAGARVGEESCLLFKPMQFMNKSGIPVRHVMDFYNLVSTDMCVLMDDVYLAPGSARIRRGGGDGGHNGLKSLIQHISPDDFMRVRIGAGIYEQNPTHRQHQPGLDEYVLMPMPRNEEEKVYQLIDKIVPNLVGWLKHGEMKEHTVNLT
jgi:PTH1 family peptidyl-tRNA hydrolase